LEKKLYEKLYDYGIVNQLLSPKNSSLKKGNGAINQLFCITDKMYKAFDNNQSVAMVFLDISMAFDRAWHRGLIFKLKFIVIQGPLLSWFEDYLSGRQQKVVLCGQESTVLSTNAGVPQGLILGPLLFLIFINDIENDIRSDMFIFADETTLVMYLSTIIFLMLNHASIVT